MPEPTELYTYNSPSDLPPIEELNPERKKKVLSVFDDSMCFPLENVKMQFVEPVN